MNDIIDLVLGSLLVEELRQQEMFGLKRAAYIAWLGCTVLLAFFFLRANAIFYFIYPRAPKIRDPYTRWPKSDLRSRFRFKSLPEQASVYRSYPRAVLISGWISKKVLV